MNATNAAAPKFVAFEISLAGTELFFTGIARFDLVNSRHADHARAFDSAEGAERAVADWNKVGHRFTVRPFPEYAAIQAETARINKLLGR
jgi:hypothetical protein